MKRSSLLGLLLCLCLLVSCASPGGSSVSSGQDAAASDSSVASSEAVISEEPAPDDGPSLPELEVSDAIDIPDLTAWALCEGERADLAAAAEAVAKTLLEEYTTEGEVGDETVWYFSPVTETPYGEYRELISLTEHTLSFQAGWLDTEETPFFQDPAVNTETAIAIARDFAAVFGLEDIAAEEPTVETDESGADYWMIWRMTVDGLPVNRPAGTLSIRIIGDNVVTLSLDRTALVPAEGEGAPGSFLSLEEAVYCINYARSLAREDYSIFYEAPNLSQVELVWVNQFAALDAYSEAYADVDFTPAYAFTFVDETGKLSYTVYVDAYTGAVETGTNEGGYPSPFQTE